MSHYNHWPVGCEYWRRTEVMRREEEAEEEFRKSIRMQKREPEKEPMARVAGILEKRRVK